MWITPDPSVCACDKDSSTASWGLRPRRLAAFGRPGSLKRSSHPASPMSWSRLRRHTFVCLELIAIVALLSPDHRLKRSEEHTSELTSIMRNSYDVFCLKKKKI